MKKLLFINTAEHTKALLCDGEKTYYAADASLSGSEVLMPLIDNLLKEAGMTLDDIEIFGVCIGPGSFTGLRIGIATIKTLCYAKNKPCFTVNNLRLNSYNNDSDRVISVADAGNNVCYIARYDGKTELDSAKCVTRSDALRFIAQNAEFAVSTDAKLEKTIPGKADCGEREMLIAAREFENSVTTYDKIEPLYIRKAQPERESGDL